VENVSQYITNHPGQLSLAISPWVGALNSSQMVVMPCRWGVKAGKKKVKVKWSIAVSGNHLTTMGNHMPYGITVLPGT